MKIARSLCLLALVAALSGHADAVYKCTTEYEVSYQDKHCVAGTETVVLIVTASLGESPQVPVRYVRTKGDAAADSASMVAVPVSVVVNVPPKD